jgi:hypothetical protein
MQYDLYLATLKIGRVSEDGRDFPNLWGWLEYEQLMRKPTTAIECRVAKFLELGIEEMKLVDVEHEKDVSREIAAHNVQMEQYRDLIESDDWFLIDENGVKSPILCPILREGGNIVWRWRPI